MDRRRRVLAEHPRKPGEALRKVTHPARALAATAVLAGAFVFFTIPAHAFEVDVGPESIVMKGKSDKLASFPHRRHQGWHGCNECHHVKDQMMTIDKCQACHDDNTKHGDLDSLKKAVHVMCKRCHIEVRATGIQSAPTRCRGGCHI